MLCDVAANSCSRHSITSQHHAAALRRYYQGMAEEVGHPDGVERKALARAGAQVGRNTDFVLEAVVQSDSKAVFLERRYFEPPAGRDIGQRAGRDSEEDGFVVQYAVVLQVVDQCVRHGCEMTAQEHSRASDPQRRLAKHVGQVISQRHLTGPCLCLFHHQLTPALPG